MKISEMVSKKDEGLNKDLSELKRQLEEARFKVSTREEKNLRMIRNIKKDIAKIMTILREREIIKEESGVKK